MRISHRFETLTREDSGKEHVFSWRADDGNFLFHAMYQSGADDIPLSDGGKAKRGKVLRIQCIENPPSFAPSKDRETGCIAIQVDDPNWTEQDYQKLAKDIREKFSFSEEQQKAMFCQLASLYNLMATQYDKLFDLELQDYDKYALQALVTDEKLATLSKWFEAQAQQAMGARDIETTLVLPRKEEAQGSKKLNFQHGIVATAKSKVHTFEVNMPDYAVPLIKAKYQSGDWGETAWISYTLPIPKLEGGKDVEVMIPFNIRDFDEKDQPKVVSADEQIERVRYHAMNYLLLPQQKAATLIMLASVYRLAATHYQKGYEPKDVSDTQSLGEYIKHKAYSHEADKLLVAASRILREKPKKAAMQYVHTSFKPENPNLVEQTIANKTQAILDMDSSKVSIDTTFMPPKDFERAWKEYLEHGFTCSKKEPVVVDTTPGLKSRSSGK